MAAAHATPLIDRMRRTLAEHQLAAPDAAVLRRDPAGGGWVRP